MDVDPDEGGERISVAEGGLDLAPGYGSSSGATADWKTFGENVVGGPINCGHYAPEEAPKETYSWFMRFLGSRSA